MGCSMQNKRRYTIIEKNLQVGDLVRIKDRSYMDGEIGVVLKVDSRVGSFYHYVIFAKDPDLGFRNLFFDGEELEKVNA